MNGKEGTQMKATGIVRRIDELGRVVIPKEIRRTQRIRRGDPLEIFTTGEGEVIFKKYSPVGELPSRPLLLTATVCLPPPAPVGGTWLTEASVRHWKR